MIVCLDWDDTLVDARSQEWLPGAVQGIKDLVWSGLAVVVCSCRASWPEGHASIDAKLAEERLGLVRVTAMKPQASVYVDDKAVRFGGDWPATVRAIREAVAR